jgi:beta-glucosidase
MPENKFSEGLAPSESPIEMLKQKSASKTEERILKNESLTFPTGFLWGASTSSYQIEGNNSNTDWWQWEKQGKTKEKSGAACDSWNRWKEDHGLLSQLGVNAYRLSLEWSRIEPEEGKFSEEAINHYREVLADLKNRNIKTVVTLWHYTLPLWFAENYNWNKRVSIKYFTRYCKKVVEELGSDIDLLVTMNEPRLVLNRGYLLGNRPPAKRNPISFLLARRHMVKAHQECYVLTKKIKPEILVGIAQYCNDFDFFGRPKFIGWLTEVVENFYNWHFFTEIGKFQDYIGINYYYGVEIHLVPPFIRMRKERPELTEMGWGICSEGIEEIIVDAWKRYKKPIYIMENGVAIGDDEIRADFINKYLGGITRAMKQNADVQGYFYWSLLDNYEWESGYDMKFGLVEIDYKTLERKPRQSFYAYRDIIKKLT